MAHLSLRDLPQPTYDALKRLAARERRSMQQQAILLLESATVLDGSADILEVAAQWRQRLQVPSDVDVVDILRAAREERP
jgi:plasmid stability protein